MPHPVVYTGTDDDDQTRSIDVVHIEPSIREGVHLVSSLYGRDASSPLFRFAPTNVFAPYLTGPEQIPGRLICNSGQWTGSPTPVLYYQWMRDGVDVPGANAYEYFTDEEDDNTVMTCEVRGANYLGEAYALTSNSISVTLIEPIEIREQEDYMVSGLHQNKVITTNLEQEYIITGVSAENRLDINRGVAYFLTGISADNRKDINAMEQNVITGLSQNDTLSILERTYGVAVISRNIGEPLVDGGGSQPLRLINGDARLGVLAWERFGSVGYDDQSPHVGDWVFWGGADADPAQNNTPYSYMWQDVPLYDMHFSDIDAGTCFVEIDWFQTSSSSEDMANIKVEFYGADGTTLLGLNSGPGLQAAPEEVWFFRNLDVAIPPNTRYIRVFQEYNLVLGTDINAYIDSIAMRIRKGSKQVSRSFGPNFEQWRLRFIQANTYSGGGLSELEFRVGPGGLDLATGGSPIFGSAGQGVSNADLAFDDLKNTGYWAGAENSIAEGTSWIGYNMGTPCYPQELEITARPGSDALQVPRQFYLEGSDDGIQWTPVFLCDETLHTGGVSYNSGESKTIKIPYGLFPFFKDHPDVGSPGYTRSSVSEDNYWCKGSIYRSVARFNIDELSVLVNDNVNTPINCRLELYRMGDEVSGGTTSFNTIVEVLESISFQAGGVNGGDTWISVPTLATHEFEVGSYFMIRFVDEDAASNPEDANEGRTRWVSAWNGPSQYQMRRLATHVKRWDNSDLSVLEAGDYNPWASSTATNYFWAVDYAGEVF